MTYEIEHKQANTGHADILAGWVLYLVVILSLMGYQLVQVWW